MRLLAILLLALAAGVPVLAQEPEPPDEPEATTPAPEGTRPARTARRGPVTVEWIAPEPLRALFRRHLPPPDIDEGERRRLSLRPWLREVRRRVPEIAGSEGYFSATVDVDMQGEDRDHVTITVTPGARTTVGAVDIAFRGDLALEGAERDARRKQLRDSWTLKAGAPFRSADWDVAKTRLHEELVEEDYAAGELAHSEAVVDADTAKATLKLVLDSGPPFTLGDVEIHGIDKYSESVVRRLVDLRRGERYSAARLTELQRLLQEGPWFSSVVVDVARDRDKPGMVPVSLTVTERPRREVGVALGYGTDDGVRGEVAFRHRDLFDRGFDLQSSVRVSQERQIGYVDVYFPPGLYASRKRGAIPFKDSLGWLAERSTFENLDISRFAVAGYRHFRLEDFETRVGLSYQIERSRPEGAEERIKRALAPIVAVTWRHVDNIFDPRRGGVLNVQLAAGSKSLASGDDFLKTYAQYQYWFPLGANDQLLLRTEVGRTHTPGRERIPEDFLFRAGGSRSNRGYAFQSLGVQEGQAVVGGRYMATGTVEYVHWLNEKWGAAAFVDVGDAKDNSSELKPNQSYGIGARFRTPAGPFALDLAYAEEPRKFRLAFSVTVAF
ncbi:MAG TPA: autotransporter assembly complex family protein [Usitatibacter sp.]|nr:autotransporter assembly complex family protein [Usitatibacter sp.]